MHFLGLPSSVREGCCTGSGKAEKRPVTDKLIYEAYCVSLR